MASFSFGAGNAAKILRLPLYAAGRLATWAIPRSRDRWVFGCAVGVADGALALWNEVRGDVADAVWLTGSDREGEDAAARGIRSVPRRSLRGFWRTARAGVVVVTHGFGDVNRYATSGAFVVQLWHGIPLKRIGLDAAPTTEPPSWVRTRAGARVMRRVLALAYRHTTRRIDLIPAASHLVRGRLQSAFSLPDAAVPVTGEPRVDVLRAGDPAGLRRRARQALSDVIGVDAASGALVLYAPTWRDGHEDAAIPDDAQWRRIHDVLAAHDATLVVRPHPLGQGRYAAPAAASRIVSMGSDRVADATPLLPAFDVLITDYSSIVFDAALVPVPAVFLAPDVDDYTRRHGLYGRYADVAGEDWATDWDGALTQLGDILGDDTVRAERLDRARALSARVHAYEDADSAARVHRAIRARRRHRTAYGEAA